MTIRRKVVCLFTVLIALLLVSSCKESGAEEDSNHGFIITEIETGFESVSNIVFNESANIACMTGYPSPYQSAILMIDAETLDITELKLDFEFDESQRWVYVYQCDIGFWLSVHVRIGVGMTSTNHWEAWLFSHELEFVSKIDDLGEGTIYGVTKEGLVVMEDVGKIYSINTEGERVKTWDVTEAADGYEHAIYRIATDGKDIFFASADFPGTRDKGRVSIFKLCDDGNVEKLYTDFFYRDFFIGHDGRLYLHSTDEELFVINEKGELEFLFSTRRLDIVNSSIYDFVVLGEDRYLFTYYKKLYLATKDIDEAAALSGEPDLRKVLTLACYNPTGIEKEIVEWNRTNEEYRIEVKNYSQYDDGLLKLNLELITGNVPDMFYWSFAFGNPFQPTQYTRAGYLLDLYTLLDNDLDIGRETLVPSLLKALESSSAALYELPMAYILWVVAGSVDVFGTEMGLTPDEFFNILESRPEVDVPFGTTIWQIILRLLIYNNMDTYVDYENAKCNFDTEEFKRFLEIAKIYYGEVQWLLHVKTIQEGRQILSDNLVSTVKAIQQFPPLFGGEVNYIGFPTSRGVGNAFILYSSISICAQSENAEASWEFIKGIMSYKSQMTEPIMMFPSNAAALEERLNNPTNYEYGGVIYGTRDGEGDIWRVTLGDPTSEDAEAVRKIIESCDRVYREDRFIMTIIEEEVEVYFNGIRSINDVVRVIQSRVQLYLDEQFGWN